MLYFIHFHNSKFRCSYLATSVYLGIHGMRYEFPRCNLMQHQSYAMYGSDYWLKNNIAGCCYQNYWLPTGNQRLFWYQRVGMTQPLEVQKSFIVNGNHLAVADRSYAFANVCTCFYMEKSSCISKHFNMAIYTHYFSSHSSKNV